MRIAGHRRVLLISPLLVSFMLPLCHPMVSAFLPTALVTGSTDGIGVTTAKNLAAKGYNVIVHGRDAKRIDTARTQIQTFINNNRRTKDHNDSVLIETVQADLSTIHGCERLAEDVKNLCKEKDLTLTVLMNNAGVYSEKLEHTSDGLEMTFAVNVLAPFILTSHLLPELLLKHDQKSRIVIASSISQCRSIRDWDDLQYHNKQRSFSAHGSYSESKFLDAMLSKEFADRLQEAGYDKSKITCNSLDPGTVNTKMLLAGWGPCGIDVEDALDQTYLCTSPDVDGVSGEYFTWRIAKGSSYPKDERQKMWKILADLAPSAAKMWDFD